MTGLALAVDALLAVVVVAGWFGTLGFARLQTPLDRLHCVTFVNVVAGGALAVLGFVADGPWDRAGKILLMVAVSLLSGAATAHAIGRALLQRGSAPELGR